MRRPDAQGKIVVVTAVNPETICHPQALLAAAILSVGVRQHPLIPFEILAQEIGGQVVTAWRWTFQGHSADGLYETALLVRWWTDEAWLAANPEHEFTKVRAALFNLGFVAKGVRESHARLILQRGDLSVRIPMNATPARKQHLLDVVEGRVSVSEPFAA